MADRSGWAEKMSDASTGTRLRAVTPAGTDLPDGVCNALIVIADGAVEVIAENDSLAVDLGDWSAGSVIPVRCKRVTTNTDATVIALYA